jgi:hypothetical protein
MTRSTHNDFPPRPPIGSPTFDFQTSKSDLVESQEIENGNDAHTSPVPSALDTRFSERQHSLIILSDFEIGTWDFLLIKVELSVPLDSVLNASLQLLVLVTQQYKE